MSTLDRIIDDCENKFKTGGEIENVKYPKVLIRALKEARGMIGMYELKDSIAMATLGMLKKKKKDDAHTVFCGPPGVGKTSMGIIWGKIIYSMGYLEERKTSDSFFDSLETQNFIIVGMMILSYAPKMLNYISMKTFAIGAIFSLILYYIIISIIKINKDKNLEDGNTEDRDIVKVVSREDFVAGYIGQSETKTMSLLKSNIGRVLFIDEAYSLVPKHSATFGDMDYGKIVLDIINRFMSENPNKIVIIFAGYEDKLKDTLIAAQPGFERRIKYTFNCERYNGEELSKIFFKHTLDSGYKLRKNECSQMMKEITNNMELFYNGQGGDMNKLKSHAVDHMFKRTSLSELNNTKKYEDDDDDENEDNEEIITLEDVKSAIKYFKTNKLKGKDEKKRVFGF